MLFSLRRNTLSSALTLALALTLSACSTVDERARPAGIQRCESFFIYDLCVSDLNGDRAVDYMYFDDTRETFMYALEEFAEVREALPLHPCAIVMSDSTRALSTELLYGEDLSLSQRLKIKGRLIANYRKAQPTVAACNSTKIGAPPSAEDDPFLAQDDWDDLDQ